MLNEREERRISHLIQRNGTRRSMMASKTATLPTVPTTNDDDVSGKQRSDFKQ